MDSEKSKNLTSEIMYLFRESNNYRAVSGVTSHIQRGCVREMIDNDDHENFKFSDSEDCDENCEEDCSACNSILDETCTIEQCAKSMCETSPFHSLSDLLITVKKYEYISLVENAYAQIGNKPFALVSQKEAEITDDEKDNVAQSFYEYLEAFLEDNQVKINEIPEAFNLATLSELTETLADNAQQEAQESLDEAIKRGESVLEKVFQRSDFMKEYLEVAKDTTNFPIGVLWIDEYKLSKKRLVKNGKVTVKADIDADVKRIHPSNFWATTDWQLNKTGRAVFKLETYSAGDLRRWLKHDIVESQYLKNNIRDYLEDNKDGYRMTEAMIFKDYSLLNNGNYDVLVCRGTFSKSSVAEMDIDIPKQYELDDYIPIECYISNGMILRLSVLDYLDDNLGVYTTVFRRRNDSIWGYSLYEFIEPFAKLYRSAIDAIDTSVGKSTGSIVQIDTAGISDAENQLSSIHNDDSGNRVLDLSGDTTLEFDSTEYLGGNFKGVPLTISQFPSNLGQLLPIVDFIFQELEKISGIPNMLINGNNISSALRTTENYNAAFTASAKVIKSLLREQERRILKPSIKYIFDLQAIKGELEDLLIESEPEILLSDTLTKQMNDDQMLLQGVQVLSQYSELIPKENLSKLINTVGRKLYHLDSDLIPDVGILSTFNPSETQNNV